jgi:hypothetical protein
MKIIFTLICFTIFIQNVQAAGQVYFGKIRNVNGDEITVSLWSKTGEKADLSEEIIGELKRSDLVDAKIPIEAGQIFRYRVLDSSTVKISRIKGRLPTIAECKKAIEKLKAEGPEFEKF